MNYEYGELNPDGSLDPAKNTGNIARQTLTFNGLASPLVQSYWYDSLYRITEAKETANGVQNWVQNWEYDRFGNRTAFTQDIAGVSTAPNPTIDANTNRFNTGQGFTYDKNGNVVQDIDAVTSQSRSFVFNGDNKQTIVKDANGNTVAEYFYDGEGKRIKKEVTATGETTVFVYSSGKLVAEYSTAAPPSNPAVSYTTTDHLGSPRVITDALGQVTSRRDFLPFGEDIVANVGGRTTALKCDSTSDSIRQKFTGYQKDTETGLDFAEARMYANTFGRFTAVDPLLASGKSANPQTFNRYIYVGNSPLVISDPSGLFGDYYDKNGRWLGNDGVDDHRIYFGKYAGRNKKGQVLVSNYYQTTYAAVINARHPQAELSPLRQFVLGFNRGYNDSISGIKKGFGNFGINAVNGVTDSLTGGQWKELGGYKNPFEIGRYQYNSVTQAKFGFGSEFGLAIGSIVAGGVFSGTGSSSLSVVPKFSPIETPYGPAAQSFSGEALTARGAVEDGALLYRRGTLGTSQASEGQFWSLEHPITSNYASKSGLPSSSTNFNFIETGRLRAGHPFVTRPAPAFGTNPGGGIEVITNPCAVRLCSFSYRGN